VGAITDIIEYRFALRNFVMRDLTLRYKRSFFGFLWSLLNPLLMILTFIIVFKYIFVTDEKNYSAKLFTTILAWRFFNQAVMDGSATVGSRLGLLKQVRFPSMLLPLSSLLANFIDFLLAICLLVAYFIAVRVTLEWHYLLLVLVALVIQILFTFGLSLMLASLSVFYSDVQFLVGNLFQMWFFLTPVFYSASLVLNKFNNDPTLPVQYKYLYFLNPMAPVMMAYRSIVPDEKNVHIPTVIFPEYYTFLGLAAITAVITFIIGLVLFKRLEPVFAKQ
jgi:ABC-type polysaccharide/polyol phosphate export permease